MVSADGGKSWAQAALQEPVHAARRSRASACRGAGTAGRSSCKAAPGTRPATCSRCAPSSSRRAARPRSRCTNPLAFPNQHYNSLTSWGDREQGGDQACLRVSDSLPSSLALVVRCRHRASPKRPNLGKPITEADIAAWDIAVMPDGTGLPPGSGTRRAGRPIYAQKCALCHGEGGKGGAGRAGRWSAAPADRAASIRPRPSPTSDAYATTLFDFTRRAMPFRQPRTLTDDEVYALTAYILALNKLIGENDVMNAKTAAEGEDAEPRQVHHPLTRIEISMIIWRRERCVRFGSKANVRAPNCDVR